MQNNPMVMRNQMEMAKLQDKGQEREMKKQIHQAELQIDVAKLKVDQMKILSDVAIAKDNSVTQRIKADAERFAKQVELALKKKDMYHRHFKESIETHHKVHHDARVLEHGARRQ